MEPPRTRDRANPTSHTMNARLVSRSARGIDTRKTTTGTQDIASVVCRGTPLRIRYRRSRMKTTPIDAWSAAYGITPAATSPYLVSTELANGTRQIPMRSSRLSQRIGPSQKSSLRSRRWWAIHCVPTSTKLSPKPARLGARDRRATSGSAGATFGTGMPRTRIVMAMANTPSLNASRRPTSYRS